MDSELEVGSQAGDLNKGGLRASVSDHALPAGVRLAPRARLGLAVTLDTRPPKAGKSSVFSSNPARACCRLVASSRLVSQLSSAILPGRGFRSDTGQIALTELVCKGIVRQALPPLLLERSTAIQGEVASSPIGFSSMPADLEDEESFLDPA